MSRIEARIVHYKDDPDNAWLVDLNSVFVTKYNGKKAKAVLAAVDIGPMNAGELKEAEGRLVFPRPGVLINLGQMPIKQLQWRGICPDAAEALLDIARCAVSIDPKGHATVGDGSWDNWAFLTAWAWSPWQDQRRGGVKKWPLRERWQILKALGYPHGESAFRKMCSERLRLFVTKSGPWR